MSTMPAVLPPVNVGVTLTEVLPDGLGAIRFTPADPDDPPAAGDLPAAGTLRIDNKRSSTTYTLTEFGNGWDGRSFHFEKVDAGTDKEESNYDVFVGRNGSDFLCTCRGHTFHGCRCKHILSAQALIENGWV